MIRKAAVLLGLLCLSTAAAAPSTRSRDMLVTPENISACAENFHAAMTSEGPIEGPTVLDRYLAASNMTEQEKTEVRAQCQAFDLGALFVILQLSTPANPSEEPTEPSPSIPSTQILSERF